MKNKLKIFAVINPNGEFMESCVSDTRESCQNKFIKKMVNGSWGWNVEFTWFHVSQIWDAYNKRGFKIQEIVIDLNDIDEKN